MLRYRARMSTRDVNYVIFIDLELENFNRLE